MRPHNLPQISHTLRGRKCGFRAAYAVAPREHEAYLVAIYRRAYELTSLELALEAVIAFAFLGPSAGF